MYMGHIKFLINIFEAIVKCNHCNDNFPWHKPIMKADKLEKALGKPSWAEAWR